MAHSAGRRICVGQTLSRSTCTAPSAKEDISTTWDGNGRRGRSPQASPNWLNRDFPDETPPTNVVGDFAERTEAWSAEQRFSWFAAVSTMEIYNAIFTILTL